MSAPFVDVVKTGAPILELPLVLAAVSVPVVNVPVLLLVLLMAEPVGGNWTRI